MLIAGVVLFVSIIASGRTHYLLSAEQVQAPILRDKRLYYTLDLVFDETPRHYWVYYDGRDREFVVDLYGAEIKARSELDTVVGIVFKGLSVVNRESSMSLSGKQAQIRIGSEPGWHFTADEVDHKTVRISAWKRIEAPRPDKKEYRPLMYIVSAVGIAVISFLGITYGIDYLENR